MCATEEGNFSLGHQARRAFSQLARPVFGALLAGYFLKNILPGLVSWLSTRFLRPVDDLFVTLLILFIFLLTLVGSLASGFLELGAFRLCLDWGEGREGTMLRTILSRWKTYRGWVLWTVGLTFVWGVGRGTLNGLIVRLLDYTQIDFYYTGKAYFNVAMALLSLFVIMLLVLSAKTAYLRAPERGFWRAVRFGVREGLRKWPKTIKPQLKYVVSVHVAVAFLGALYRNLVRLLGGDPLSWVGSLPPLLLGMAAQAWVLTVYGCLAAVWYDPPEEGE